MFTNIISRWSEIQKLKDGIIPAPYFVDFHTSNYCNQACEGCAYLADHTKDMLDEKRHFQAVDTFLEAGVKAFDFAGGGEPTMLPYLPKLMRYIHSRGASFGLITNGTVMSHELAEAIAEGATYVRVSLEASNEDDYREYKKSKLWPVVLRNISELNGYKYVDGRRNFELGIKFAVGTRLNGRNHYIDGMQLGVDLEADRITFKALRHPPDELPEVDRFHEQAILNEIIQNLDLNVVSWIAPVPFSQVPQCTLNAFHSMMDHKGNCYICCYYGGREQEHFLGNIFKTPFEDFWYSEAHWEKIKGIKREACFKEYCKFYFHHQSVDDITQRGKVNFL